MAMIALAALLVYVWVQLRENAKETARREAADPTKVRLHELIARSTARPEEKKSAIEEVVKMQCQYLKLGSVSHDSTGWHVLLLHSQGEIASVPVVALPTQVAGPRATTLTDKDKNADPTSTVRGQTEAEVLQDLTVLVAPLRRMQVGTVRVEMHLPDQIAAVWRIPLAHAIADNAAEDQHLDGGGLRRALVVEADHWSSVRYHRLR